MKTTKSSTRSTPTEEECSIWLDTTELRRKKLQEKLVQPISKFLSPLVHSRGYSVAVALNFTQIKQHVPVTRQSTISSFFTPKNKDHCINSRDLARIVSDEVCSGTKREREKGPQLPSAHVLLSSLASGEKQLDEDTNSDRCGLPSEDIKDWDKEHQLHQLIAGYQSMEEEPAEKRRRLENYGLQRAQETQEDLSKYTMHRGSQASQSKGVLEPKTLSSWQPNQKPQEVNSRNYRWVHGHETLYSVGSKPLCMGKDTSTQQKHIRMQQSFEDDLQIECKSPLILEDQVQSPLKPSSFKLLTKVNRGKENFPSTCQGIGSSPLKQQPLLCAVPTCKMNCVPLAQSLVVEPPLRETETDTCAVLFTQDSEGFRAISHCDGLYRSPFKDCTNIATWKNDGNVPCALHQETEEEPYLESKVLFTQDSQGNMVIKH